MVETLTIFDDVFVPWSGSSCAASTSGPASWRAASSSSTASPPISIQAAAGRRADRRALLAARVNGPRAGRARSRQAVLAGLLRRDAARPDPPRRRAVHRRERGGDADGHAAVNIAKLQFAQGLHTAFQYVQDITGGLLATYPAPEDLDHPEYGQLVRKYLAGAKGVDGAERCG